METNRYFITEESALEKAVSFYEELPSIEKDRYSPPLQLLEAEESYFREAMILQIAAFALIRNHFPFEDRGEYTYAANTLAFSTFDHLRRGWLCILEGYYRVAMTIARNVFEATVFETAIGVGLAADFKKASDTHSNNLIYKWLSEWWRGEFKAGTVQKLISLVEKELNKRGTGGETVWAKNAKTMWETLRGWAHANWESMALSGVSVALSKNLVIF